MAAAEKSLTASLGLMSGTSLDGIDLALMLTDGEGAIHFQRDGFVAYDAATRDVLGGVLDAALHWPTAMLAHPADWPPQLRAAEEAVTAAHLAAVQGFITDADNLALIGFHGQTITHRPDEGFTLQIGDGQALAQALGCDVVGQFRRADMENGGQGAPLAPLFHGALVGDDRPQAVLNLGGVGNITWLGTDAARDDDMLAFDTGPANALIDDWVRARTGAAFDQDGALAAAGQLDRAALAGLMAHDYFDKPPPKSLDRLSFPIDAIKALSAEDGAATLTAFTAQAVAQGLDHCPAKPARLIVCGGGRHNKTLCAMLAERCGVDIIDCDALAWRGDSLEAQAFAWLAVRALNGLPLSRPETTGVAQPCTGGVVYKSG
jgi:anhydro-N-acetylmuramic acid kinase